MKRFYKAVSAEPHGDGFAIYLDGKPVRTPSGSGLVAPTKAMADLVAAEWEAQTDKIVASAMPLTQIVAMTHHHVRESRTEIMRLTLAYLDTDLLCYRTEQPETIASRQASAWDPWLVWFAQKSGVTLHTTTELSALRQPQAAHDYVAAHVGAMDLWYFSVLQMVTSISGSIVLALAFVAGDIAPEELFKAIHIEEDYRAEIYHEDVHGMAPHQEKARVEKMLDLLALRQILDSV